MKVGDKVECINTNWSVNPNDFPQVTFPVKGQILTIRGINEYSNGLIGLVFEEIKNPLKDNPKAIEFLGYNSEYDFAWFRFRKLQRHGFRNKLTKKLAHKALEEFPEYNPEELLEERVILS